MEVKMNEDWPVLLSFFPDNWVDLAFERKAVKNLRKSKDVENYIRILLLHVGCGYSLRETVTRAKLAGLADISDVALLGRLRKAKDWLHGLCVALMENKGVDLRAKNGLQVRLFDAANVKEPGKTGSLWRIHYSIQIPSLTCDFFKLTATKGAGTGESFFQYSIKKNDYIIADRGYSSPSGIHHVASKNAFVTVRVNTGTLPLLDPEGRPFHLLEKVHSIKYAGGIKSWDVAVPRKDDAKIQGRLCVIKKSNEAIKAALEKLKRKEQKKQTKLRPETLEYAKYVILFTTFPENQFSVEEILEWYRTRWQIELTFKRFKSIAQLGHLPKQSDESSEAWLYGKLFVALLTENIIQYANSVSPWGYIRNQGESSEFMA